MIKQHFKILSIGFICILFAGCLSFGSLSNKQIKVLKKEGFVLTEEGWSLGLPEQLLFQSNEATISEANAVRLNNLAQQLQKYKLTKLRIVGHTDNVGSAEYNLKLSEKRAISVSSIFIKNGFSASNVASIGRGETQPLNQNESEQARAENRRVSIIIIP